MLSIYAVSTQYVTVAITNAEGINPTSDVVKFAFLGPCSNSSQAAEAVPTSATTYYTGSWPSTSPAPNTTQTYVAACLVGPSGGVVTLATGTYLCVVKVTDSPEQPILFSGTISVT